MHVVPTSSYDVSTFLIEVSHEFYWHNWINKIVNIYYHNTRLFQEFNQLNHFLFLLDGHVPIQYN